MVYKKYLLELSVMTMNLKWLKNTFLMNEISQFVTLTIKVFIVFFPFQLRNLCIYIICKYTLFAFEIFANCRLVSKIDRSCIIKQLYAHISVLI